ncbi:MAG: type II toxin-antitoxin system VapC family toxin [Gemmataceae bacterium]
MIFLLDTNFCVQYLRGRNPLVRQRLAAKPVQEIRLCSIVLAELYIGTLRSAQPAKNRAAVDQFAAPYAVLPFDTAAAGICAIVRHDLESKGTPIGPYDLQIAAIALAQGCTLVTHNVGEFSRVPGLLIEDWEVP